MKQNWSWPALDPYAKMKVYIIVSDNDGSHPATILIDDTILEPPTDQAKSKDALWYAYERAKAKHEIYSRNT